MNFLDVRMMRFNQRGISQPMPQQLIQHQPPPVVEIQAVQPEKPKKKKAAFNISDDKDQIIIDIIREKPNIVNCRKALKRYAEISTEEHYEELFN